MYSHEDRKRAAELYIECGLSAADVIRELGHPNRHSPRNWHEDYLGHGGVRESAHEPRFHSDISTTQIYTHVDRSHIRDEYLTCHPRARMRPRA